MGVRNLMDASMTLLHSLENTSDLNLESSLST